MTSLVSPRFRIRACHFTASYVLLILLCVAAQGGASAAEPTIPAAEGQLFYDVDYSRAQPGAVEPMQISNEEVEAFTEDQLPIRQAADIDRVTEVNHLMIEESPLGMKGNALVLSYEETNTEFGDWGPRLSFTVPYRLVAQSALLTYKVRVPKDRLASSGAVLVPGMVDIAFHKNGSILATAAGGEEKLTLGEYQPDQPINIEVRIDCGAKLFEVLINGKLATAEPVSFVRDRLPRVLQVTGLSPGGFATVPGKLALQSVRIVVE
jgi:hypothetical protein